MARNCFMQFFSMHTLCTCILNTCHAPKTESEEIPKKPNLLPTYGVRVGEWVCSMLGTQYFYECIRYAAHGRRNSADTPY